MKPRWLLALGLLFLISANLETTSAQQTKKPFTVADEIGLVSFDDPNGIPGQVHFSPDGKYFAVWTERGNLNVNRVEDSLRFYRSEDIEDFLKHPNQVQPPSPAWVVNRSYNEGPIISNWRWLADSSGIAFLERASAEKKHLVLADLRSKKVEQLTAPEEIVGDFDVRDRQHYVYTVANFSEEHKRESEQKAAAVVGTGRNLFELILPTDPVTAKIASSPSTFWAVAGGKPVEVKASRAAGVDDKDRKPLAQFGGFSLSPDGKSIVTTLPVTEVPASWETLYPPPYPGDSHSRIHAGHPSGVNQFVRVDLQSGEVTPLVDAPTSDDGGWWWGGNGPSWSSDGRTILLPGTFVKTEDGSPSRPCVAIVDVKPNQRSCVEILKRRNLKENTFEPGYHTIMGAEFVNGDRSRIQVNFISHDDQSFGSTQYERTPDGSWKVSEEIKGNGKAKHGDLEVEVKQSMNDAPVLVTRTKQASRVILDPNPRLKDIELGEATVYNWKDKEGRQWKGGLYKPVNYQLRQRYPLVIQTHGFDESRFLPSGVFPTAMAARALAAHGIMVLQTASGVNGANCPVLTPEEGSCGVELYESAVKQLAADGLVEPERVGAIGFSRTCFSVIETLTFGSVHLRAASVTDGVMFDYLQFILFPERISGEANKVIGAPPFGEGLQQWLKRSPGFNLDKINTPLLVVGEGPASLIHMWEPYAALHYLKEPVELVMLNTDEHVLTNPAVRMASQGGSVDWFRFWLQDYEDPDPAKKEQYERWRGLKKMQQENEAKARAAQN